MAYTHLGWYHRALSNYLHSSANPGRRVVMCHSHLNGCPSSSPRRKASKRHSIVLIIMSRSPIFYRSTARMLASSLNSEDLNLGLSLASELSALARLSALKDILTVPLNVGPSCSVRTMMAGMSYYQHSKLLCTKPQRMPFRSQRRNL